MSGTRFRPPIVRKPRCAGNRTRDFWICNQELWLLDLRGIQITGRISFYRCVCASPLLNLWADLGVVRHKFNSSMCGSLYVPLTPWWSMFLLPLLGSGPVRAILATVNTGKNKELRYVSSWRSYVILMEVSQHGTLSVALLLFKIRHFGDSILFPCSGGTYWAPPSLLCPPEWVPLEDDDIIRSPQRRVLKGRTMANIHNSDKRKKNVKILGFYYCGSEELLDL
jgi:hypothetical protein